MKLYTTVTLLFVFCPLVLTAQVTEIKWQNPSFEGKAKTGLVPEGWESHSFEGHTPPDTQPCNCGGVYKKAADGDTYIGLLIREDNSWEAIGQLLPIELIAGQTYMFNLNACRASRYLQLYGQDKMITNFRRPAIIRLWGGTYSNPFVHLLAQTETIFNEEWKPYTLIFNAPGSINYLTLEAYFSVGTAEAYHGNVLIDQLSPIRPVPDSTLTAMQVAMRQEGIAFDPPDQPYYANAKEVSISNSHSYTDNRRITYKDRKKLKNRIDHGRLNRRELIIQAQREMELAKAPTKKELMKYEDPTLIDYSKSKQARILEIMPSDAEAVFIPSKIRKPIVSRGKDVLSYTFQPDTSIMMELAQLIDNSPDYTLIIAVVAPQQGVRDKVAWELDGARQQLGIEEKIIQIEQYVGQNTYFKDWLWQVEDNRVMMRVVQRE
jgi:hypothetical protein